MQIDHTPYKTQFKTTKRRLKEKFLKTNDPLLNMRDLSNATDALLKELWFKTHQTNKVALIAVGGYGRGTLHPFSDIDILILSREELSQQDSVSLETFIRLLWDIGLEVGHSVRTLEDCLSLGLKDVTVLTTFLESRLLAGCEEIFNSFGSLVKDNLDVKSFISKKLKEQVTRHAQARNTAYSLEPNIKECPGGLRDLHTIIWIAKAANHGGNWSELFLHNIITRQEFIKITRYQALLNRIRIYLHYEADRREDRLSFDYQLTLAEKFGFTDNTAKRSSEQLMQKFYRTVRSIRLINKIITQNLSERITPLAHKDETSLNRDFKIVHNLLDITSTELFEKKPSALIECFRLWQINNDKVSGLSVRTMRAIWSITTTNSSISKKIKNHRVFLNILKSDRVVTNTLRRMNHHGILGLYIPSFKRVVGQMQHDLFHVYTVDEHILMVIRNLRRFAIPDMAHEFPLCSELMFSFNKPELLYIAALFHDIAKGRGGDHSELGMIDAKNFCIKHELDDKDTDLIVWLVQNHLLMSSCSQKQDFENPKILQEFVNTVKTEYRLTALYLLTVADVRGTSDKVWNSWKSKLLEDLFILARKRITQRKIIFNNGGLDDKKHALKLQLKQEGIPEKDCLDIWKSFDVSYFSRFDDSEVLWHTKLLHENKTKQLPIVKTKASFEINSIEVFVYTKDRHNLFARVCGFFQNMNLEIVKAKVFTSHNKIALDSFTLLADASIKPQITLDIESQLKQLLTNSINYSPPTPDRLSAQQKYLPIPPKVEFRPDEGGKYYYLNITGADQPALLYRIASLLSKHQVHIQTAKINTLGGRAEDSFLVKGSILGDANGIHVLENELAKLL